MDTKVEEDVFKMLSSLDEKNLNMVCVHLEIDGKITDKQGKKSSLLKFVLRYLSSEQIEGLEDEGLSTFLLLQEFIKQLLIATNKTLDEDNKSELIPKTEETFTDSTNVETKFKPEAKHETIFDSDFRQLIKREFKINGKIGKAGQKESITFSSLSYQIEHAKSSGYSDRDICLGVIKSISPDCELRTYLESKQTDLKTLSKVLRSHFKEKDATTLFTTLSNAKQGIQESPNDFVMRLLALRQKVLFVSKENVCQYEYPLVQERFLHAVLTGLRSDYIRSELRDLLKSKSTSDEDLLDRLTIAVSDDSERLEKFNSRPKQASVNSLSLDSDFEQPQAPKKENFLLKELSEIKAQLNQLSVVKREVEGMREFVNRDKTSNKGNFQTRCNDCVEKHFSKCDHCLTCGSTEHFKAGCKKRFSKSPKN